MAEPTTETVDLTESELQQLSDAIYGRGNGTGLHLRGPVPEAVQRIIAARQAESLALVKQACDVECKSPGKHTGCSSHEPYRVLRDAVYPPGQTAGGEG